MLPSQFSVRPTVFWSVLSTPSRNGEFLITLSIITDVKGNTKPTEYGSLLQFGRSCTPLLAEGGYRTNRKCKIASFCENRIDGKTS